MPLRAGIRPNSVFLPPLIDAESWPRVLDFLIARFPAIPADEWRRRMEHGDVLDSQGISVPVDAPYRPATRLYYYREQAAEIIVPFQEIILFEDENLLVVDKPHFLPTQPSGAYVQETLISRLRHKQGSGALEALHRLDRDTAGLVMIARNARARDAYHALFRQQQITKTYLAVASLNGALSFPLTHSSRIGPAAEFYRRQEVSGPVNAITRIELIARQDALGLYRLFPLTGKTHQLRIHMAALGIPILNDPYYPIEKRPLEKGQLEKKPLEKESAEIPPVRPPDDFAHPLQLLAQELAFIDPISGEPRHFVSARTLTLTT
ncbi:MAG TPA: pseudouridine synthase [Dongiaceae bacterium]|nr:pseudouridine synthase [Dongiaceae bacterium]